MKHTQVFGIVLTLVSFLICVQCDKFINEYVDGNKEIKQKFQLTGSGIPLYGSASNTAPVVKESSILTRTRTDTSWNQLSERVTYWIFNTFREFDPDKHNGILDHSNIYKVLYDVGFLYTNALEEIASIYRPMDGSTINDSITIDTAFDISSDSVVPIQSPFDFGKTTKAYRFAYKHGALSKKGNTIFALLTWDHTEGATKSYGVLETNFNKVSGDIELDVTNLVVYSPSSSYTNRMFLKGNEKDHTFMIKFTMPNPDKNAKAFSIIGTGVSKSNSPDDYFLLKIQSNYFKKEIWVGDSKTVENIYPEGRYYTFNAGPNENSLKAYQNYGYPLDSISDPKNYSQVLDTMTFFDMYGADNPSTVDDFLNGTIELSF